MKRIKTFLAAAFVALATVGVVAPAAHADASAAYAACSDMTFLTYMGSSNNGYAPPRSQATFIAASQQWNPQSFSLIQASTNFPEGISFSCTSRYEYNDYFGLYRLIKVETHPVYDGNGGVQAWAQWGRTCYYRSSPSNSWTPWSC